MSNIEYADSLPKAKLYLVDGNVLIGKSLGFEEIEDENEELTGEMQIAFVPSFVDFGFYIPESEILKVEAIV